MKLKLKKADKAELLSMFRKGTHSYNTMEHVLLYDFVANYEFKDFEPSCLSYTAIISHMRRVYLHPLGIDLVAVRMKALDSVNYNQRTYQYHLRKLNPKAYTARCPLCNKPVGRHKDFLSIEEYDNYTGAKK
jgi:hypothetical protein